MAKKKDIRDLEDSEILQKLTEMDEQTFRLRFQMSMGQTDGLKNIRINRKERARLLTIQRERELAKEAVKVGQ